MKKIIWIVVVVVVVLLVSGSCSAYNKMVKGEVTGEVPASILQMHPDCTLIADEAAARKL